MVSDDSRARGERADDAADDGRTPAPELGGTASEEGAGASPTSGLNRQAEAAATATSPSSKNQAASGPKLGSLGTVRWFWRQLTSMRTALFLLLLVAVGAIPGSIFPQKSIDATRVTQYHVDHPQLSPWLDRFGMFNVYSSPWFSAIYLLLAISLIGCVVPRIGVHAKAMKAGPPRMPRNITRLPAHETFEVAASEREAIDVARSVLRKRRFRMRQDVGEYEISAEGGMMRETGNLLFHMSLIGIIAGVAAGYVWGWRGDVIVPEGGGFSSTVTRYDTMQVGPWVNVDSGLPQWSLNLKKLKVTFEKNVSPSSPQWGQPRDFTANVRYKGGAAGAWKNDKISVNHPLSVGGGDLYLLGNGYAPRIIFKDAKGNTLYDEATPFLSIDNKYKSTGAFKIPGATPHQIGFSGFFLPTAYYDQTMGPSSAFPDLWNPELALGVYTGNLFPQGRPQSVFSLDTTGMNQVKDSKGNPYRLELRLGQTVKLPNNLGSVTFASVPRWAGLTIRHDPGEMPALIFSVLALTGLVLSLTIRRRRIFVRVLPGSGESGSERTVVEIGGLAKGEDPRLAVAVNGIRSAIEQRTAGEAR